MLENNYRRLNSLAAGDSLTRPAVPTKIEEANKDGGKGDPYVSFTLKDSQTSVKANMFQLPDGRPATKQILETMGITEETLVTVTIEKNNKGFINVTNINTNVDPDVKLEDFAQHVEGNHEEGFEEIVGTLKDVIEETQYTSASEKLPLSNLALNILLENKNEFMWSAAAEMMHSEKAGGLVEHTGAMLKNGIKICETYPDLDKDLLVSGIVLHDIGKLEELKTDALGSAKYTPKGTAIGHLVLGCFTVDRFVQKHLDDYSPERVMMLQSMILSHQGHKEYGSPVEPISKEAYMLYFLDEMDAKYHEMKKALDSTKPGSISDSKPIGINHKIYRPKEEE